MTFTSTTLIGESFVGEGANAAHINVVIGSKGGPVEIAWTTALATPRIGHTPFVAVLRPSLPVLPLTLFVNKAATNSDLHGKLTWGAAQAGVASGVASAVNDGLIPAEDARDLLCIAAVWVDPEANDEEEVFANNQASTRGAIEAAVHGTPSVADTLEYLDAPANPFYGSSQR